MSVIVVFLRPLGLRLQEAREYLKRVLEPIQIQVGKDRGSDPSRTRFEIRKRDRIEDRIIREKKQNGPW